MESGSRKLPSSSGGNYRRIIPPLNDTDSDSSLEYWEERGAMNDSIYPGPRVRIKKERLETVGEDDCVQRMVYKIKPIDSTPNNKSGVGGDDGAGPSGVPTMRGLFVGRRQPFIVEDEASPANEDNRRQSLANPADPRSPRSPSNRSDLPDHSSKGFLHF